MSYWYLGTPYSKYPGGIEAAFLLACRETGRLIRAGVPVYSPIAHTHPIAMAADMDPLDHTIWIPADEPLMRGALGLIVLRAATWRESKGLTIEISAFGTMDKSIVYMDPGVVPPLLARDYRQAVYEGQRKAIGDVHRRPIDP